MNKSTRVVVIATTVLLLLIVTMIGIFLNTSDRKQEVVSSPVLTLSFTANISAQQTKVPTDSLYGVPVTTITAIYKTNVAIADKWSTDNPPDPRMSTQGMETAKAQYATGFATQSTYVAKYNQMIEDFMTHYPQTPQGMRTPAEPTFITMSPPEDYSKITPIIITLGPAPTHTPTPSPTQ